VQQITIDSSNATMSAEVAAPGPDSFGANGSNAGKKAVHVKVRRCAVALLWIGIDMYEIEMQ
jgi:hypothetical protein